MSGIPGTNGLFGRDPLDSSVSRARREARGPRDSWWLRNRLALGLAATPVPGMLLVFGLALGPQGLNLLSRSVLSYLDPAVSGGLAALGLLAGLQLDLRRARERRLLGAASVEAGLTMLLVGAGVLVTAASSLVPAPSWFVAATLGVCAAASSTSPAVPFESGGSSSRLADLDDVVPVVAGGVLLAAFRGATVAEATWLTLQSLALACAVACAGWLLLARSSSTSEHHVYTAGIVLLLGGLAEFLGLSALLFGFTGGLFLSLIRGSARERVGTDLRHIQHPVVVLLLLVAGARMSLAAGALILATVYVALRLAGKIGGGALLTRLSSELPSDLPRSLISPGVIAVAFALNVGQAGGDPSGLVLAVAGLGAILTEILALLAGPREVSS